MENIITGVSAAVTAMFVTLTAWLSFKKKQVDSDATLGEQSFKSVLDRLDKQDVEIAELREFKSQYQILSDKYDILKMKYNDLRDKYDALKEELEAYRNKRGR